MPETAISISIPKETLASMPVVEFKGRIVVADTAEAVDRAVEMLSRQCIVGFDTETRPSFRKGHIHNVALMQISTADCCYLLRICSSGITPKLKEFLENEAVTKVGLSLKDDFLMLHKTAEFIPAAFVDLQEFVRRYSIIDASLQKIYGILYGQRITKGQRLTNWEAPELTDLQQQYAAIDAWACLRIYKDLSEGKFDPSTSPYILHPQEP